MSKERATDEDVMRFIRAVYPATPELALASFSEKKALNDAAELIDALYKDAMEAQTEIRRLRERADSLQNMLGEWLQWFGGINDISHRTRRTLDVSPPQEQK